MSAPRHIEPGMRFGRLTFVRDTGERRAHKRIGLFICDCGLETRPLITAVTCGNSRSCGCSRVVAFNNRSHGMYGTPEYKSWIAMLARCRNPNRSNYGRYGARGLTVCERWLTFTNFYADMGPRPSGTTLDRIDNDRGYEPGNCRWATRSEQNKNQRRWSK